MRFIRTIRNLFRSASSQRRHVAYVVKLTNTSTEQTASCDLVAPIGQTQHLQVVDGPVLFSMTPRSLGHEDYFGNQFGHWSLTIAPGKKQVVTITYQLRTKGMRIKRDAMPRATEYQDTPTMRALLNQQGVSLAPKHPFVYENAEAIKHSYATLPERIDACLALVKKTLTYGNPIPGLYTATEALSKRTVDCGGYSTLLLSLLIACGIPARLVSGFWLNKGTTTGDKAMHAWVELLTPQGSWIPVDPSVDALQEQHRTRRQGGLGIVGNDRFIVSVGSDLLLPLGDTTVHAPLLQSPLLINAPSTLQMDYHITTSYL